MHKKFLRTYTLLGLMLCSLVTPGQAGKYEAAFLEEVGNNHCKRLDCETKNEGGKRTGTLTTRGREEIGESQTGIYVTKHYQTKIYESTVYSPPDVRCTRCHRQIRDIPDMLMPNISLTGTEECVTIRISQGTIKSTGKPCRSPEKAILPNEETDYFGIICSNLKMEEYERGWAHTLRELWKIAVKLDLENTGGEGEMVEPLEKHKVETERKREVNEDSTCSVQ